jgi:hypothetical protein
MIHMALLSASMVTVRYRFTCRVEVATVNIVGQRLTAKRRSAERDLPPPAATQQAIGSEHSLQLLMAISSQRCCRYTSFLARDLNSTSREHDRDRRLNQCRDCKREDCRWLADLIIATVSVLMNRR